MHQRIRKAVFPVAGLGTRILPATKAMPKEMLTVVDRPLIQYAIEECLDAGIDEFVFVTGRNKGVIEDHFDRQFELEMTLLDRQKHTALYYLNQDLPVPGSTSFTRQQEPLGLGHAVLMAADAVGDHPFMCMLPDDLSDGPEPVLRQLAQAYQEYRTPMLALMRVPRDQISRYGCATVEASRGRVHRVTAVVRSRRPRTPPATWRLWVATC